MAKLGPGARVGDQFNLLRKIGEGGCGEVYLAEQTTLGRHAVVKLMHPELSRDASYVRRFQREAQLAARLTHHHTAAIYAFGETPDRVLWIAMEYIEGESLHNVLARDPASQVAELLVPVAELLDRAGAMGIIHRDVKPDNIIVAPDGQGRRAVLLDFGLARPMDDNDKLTAVGVAVGSPTYMSPEQVFGPTVDSATDRYALGIILYIAVAKRPPYRHEDRVQLVLMHKRQPVPALNSLVPAIPLGHPLDTFFARALAKQPLDRYGSAREMMQEFIQALSYAPLGPEPLPGQAPSAAPRPSPVPAARPTQGMPPLPPAGARATQAAPPIPGPPAPRATQAMAPVAGGTPLGGTRAPSAPELPTVSARPGGPTASPSATTRPPASPPVAAAPASPVPRPSAPSPVVPAARQTGGIAPQPPTPARGIPAGPQAVREPSAWEPAGAEPRRPADRAGAVPAVLRSTVLSATVGRTPTATSARPTAAIRPVAGAAPATRTDPHALIDITAPPPEPRRTPEPARPAAMAEESVPPTEEPPRAASFAPGHPRLLVRGSGRRFDVLCGTEALLGKHRDCDVVCRAFPTPDQDAITHGVSRQHARLRVVGGKLLVEDLSSLNGTYMDDKRLTGAGVPVADEAQIRLGPVLMLEVRLFRSGAALLRRVDPYGGGFPPTLLVWDRVALGEPLLELVHGTGDSITRWGSLAARETPRPEARKDGNPRQGGELFWNGPISVSWLRAGVAVNPRPQPVQPGDRMVLSGAVVDWEPGIKPGLL